VVRLLLNLQHDYSEGPSWAAQSVAQGADVLSRCCSGWTLFNREPAFVTYSPGIDLFDRECVEGRGFQKWQGRGTRRRATVATSAVPLVVTPRPIVRSTTQWGL